MLKRYGKSILKSMVSPLLDSCGIYDRRISQAVADNRRWTIVMYHRVVADPAADPFALGMCVRRSRFEAQIAYFRRHFEMIGLSEAVDRIERGEPLPKRAISVTFDDGYRDNLEHALPILEAYQAPATLFVPTGGLETGELLWWDRVIAAFSGTAAQSLDPRDVDLPGIDRLLSLGSWSRAASAEIVLGQLWTLPIERALDVVQRIEKVLGPASYPVVPAARLRPAEIQEMHRRGVEIGAHSVRHPNLQLVPQHELQEEMTASREVLEGLCQAPIPGFAYPGGRLNDETVDAARAVGFRYAVATISATNSAPYDCFKLRRIGMPDASLPDFKRSLGVAMQRNDQVQLHAPA